VTGHKSGWSPVPGDRYQHVVHLEHGYARWHLQHISEYGRLGVTESVRHLVGEYDMETGPVEDKPATPMAGQGYWDRVGEYLIFWHSGHAYVCLERVIPAEVTT
jgi:hypothetical protein